MKTIHFVSHVSREVSELLRKVGFDWPSIGYYNKLGFFHNAIPQYGELKAPALDVAQKWLREVKNIWVEVLLVNATDPHYRVDLVNASRYNNSYGILHDAYYKEYETPEQAQEAGIKKALELILEREN